MKRKILDLRSILEAVAKGEIGVDEALNMIRLFAIQSIEDSIRFDIGRRLRRDVPEIILGEKKSTELLVKLIKNIVPTLGRVIISRLTDEQIKALRNLPEKSDFEVLLNEVGRIAVVKLKGIEPQPKFPCSVGIVTAGTADICIAEEARVIVEEMGCKAVTIYDVGIAGFHRVISAVKKLKEADVDVVVVVAGMEGALPSVIASLIDVPVIGVPTSVGYGAGAGGQAALLSMLQSCPLGLAVVNIDNGVNAGVIAALIARRVGIFRQRCK